MIRFLGSFICLAVLCWDGADGEVMSWDAKEVLLNLAEDFGIQNITVPPRPIYRKDLPENYVAYWEIISSNMEQIIISSGPNTGDFKYKIQGPLPSMTNLLDNVAQKNGAKCHRYFMIASDVTMMCENEAGRLVATNKDDYINAGGENITEKYLYIEESLEIMSTEWQLLAKEVKASDEWEESEPELFQDDVIGDDSSEDELTINTEHDTVLVPGQSALIAIDDENISIRVVTDITEGYQNQDPSDLQQLLCHIINVCDPTDTTKLDKTKVKQAPYGQKYIELYVIDNVEDLLDYDLAFEIDIQSKGVEISRRYFIDVQKRSKRATRTTTYSTWVYHSIPHETSFPDYGQHKHSSKRCQVGCGPVAWAMIFGYYDRRSHTYPATYGTGSQGLFRCGTDGTTGSNACLAPRVNNASTKKYNEALHKALKTFCIGGQGATLHKNMDNVNEFFKARQTSGTPKVSLSRRFLSFMGIYSNKARNSMVDYIKRGWPSVVGIRVGGIFSQHYPVATRIRERTKTTRTCRRILWKTSCRTKNSKQYDMYLHMGWSGSQNGWRKGSTFLAAAARY